MSQNETVNQLNRMIDGDVTFIPEQLGDKEMHISDRIALLVEKRNEPLPIERRAILASAIKVAKRSYAENFLVPDQSVKYYRAVREVENYLELVTTGKSHESALKHSDLLDAGHPLSTTQELDMMPYEEIRELRANWVASDPRIGESHRPLVASAYLAEEGSVEKEYYKSLLNNLPQSEMPRDLLLGLIDS
jgi:hypothetical protein